MTKSSSPDALSVSANIMRHSDGKTGGDGAIGPGDLSRWAGMLHQQHPAMLQPLQDWMSAARHSGQYVDVDHLGLYSQALAHCGDLEQALSVAQRAEHCACSEGAKGTVKALMFQSDIRFRLGQREEALDLLASALRLARRISVDGLMQCLPELASSLCGRALQANIETNYVVQMIRRNGIASPSPALAIWPWAIRITTLGSFSVVCDDQLLSFKGKAPRKVLELLQALVAQGGREIHTSLLMHVVSPDFSSSNPRNLFDNTLHRLRRILGTTDVLMLNHAKLALDAGKVYVDAWAFDSLTSACVDAATSDAAKVSPLTLKDAEAALHLYQSHFLDGEAEAPWMLPYRERLRNRFHRLVRVVGSHYETAESWDAAASVYERALEIDALAETFYQQLMICHLKLGQHAAAICVYRRCREILSIVLGIAPSATTEKIRRLADTDGI